MFTVPVLLTVLIKQRKDLFYVCTLYRKRTRVQEFLQLYVALHCFHFPHRVSNAWILLARNCEPLRTSEFNCAQFRNNSVQLSCVVFQFFNKINYCAICFSNNTITSLTFQSWMLRKFKINILFYNIPLQHDNQKLWHRKTTF